MQIDCTDDLYLCFVDMGNAVAVRVSEKKSYCAVKLHRCPIPLFCSNAEGVTAC